MSDFLRRGADRYRAGGQAAAQAAAQKAREQEEFNAYVDRAVATSIETVQEFLRLMAQAGNPGLERFRVTNPSGIYPSYSIQPARFVGFRAWREASYLTPSGDFYAGGDPTAARDYLRTSFAAWHVSYSSGGTSDPPTLRDVDQRLEAFATTLGGLLAKYDITIP